MFGDWSLGVFVGLSDLDDGRGLGGRIVPPQRNRFVEGQVCGRDKVAVRTRDGGHLKLCCRSVRRMSTRRSGDSPPPPKEPPPPVCGELAEPPAACACAGRENTRTNAINARIGFMRPPPSIKIIALTMAILLPGEAYRLTLLLCSRYRNEGGICRVLWRPRDAFGKEIRYRWREKPWSRGITIYL